MKLLAASIESKLSFSVRAQNKAKKASLETSKTLERIQWLYATTLKVFY